MPPPPSTQLITAEDLEAPEWCNVNNHTFYDGRVVLDGNKNNQPDVAACCASCEAFVDDETGDFCGERRLT